MDMARARQPAVLTTAVWRGRAASSPRFLASSPSQGRAMVRQSAAALDRNAVVVERERRLADFAVRRITDCRLMACYRGRVTATGSIATPGAASGRRRPHQMSPVTFALLMIAALSFP